METTNYDGNNYFNSVWLIRTFYGNYGEVIFALISLNWTI